MAIREGDEALDPARAPAGSRHPTTSEAVGADDLAVGPGAQGPPGRLVDRVLGEPDAAVAHQDVHAAGVIAGGLDELGVADRPVGAGVPWVLLGIGRQDG